MNLTYSKNFSRFLSHLEPTAAAQFGAQTADPLAEQITDLADHGGGHITNVDVAILALQTLQHVGALALGGWWRHWRGSRLAVLRFAVAEPKNGNYRSESQFAS